MQVIKNSHVTAQEVLRGVKREIVEGVLKPGQQLPSRLELEARFGTSPVTIQRALDILSREEFVRVNGRRGTYVADAPPHLTRYALVFRNRPHGLNSYWTRFFAALQSEAMAMQKPGVRTIKTYTGIDGHADNLDYCELLSEVTSHRLAGVIFGDGPEPLFETPLLQQCEVPMVSIQGRAPEHVPVVELDLSGFLVRAVEYLARRNCTQIAVVSPSVADENSIGRLSQLCKEHGLKTKPYWYVTCGMEVAAAANTLTQLLFSNPQQCPDGLIITDDNLVPFATEGLVTAGIKVPDELQVVAHGNFPYLTPSMVRSMRLGFNSHAILERCLLSIDSRRRHEATPPSSPIPTIFEDELKEELKNGFATTFSAISPANTFG